MALDEAPPFWWQKAGVLAYSLAPIGYVWGQVAAMRMARPPSASVPVPVLCIGNFIAGGAGKTPTAIALSEAAKDSGLKPGILTRGYGGRTKGPAAVDLSRHNAADVGDEALLLAAAAHTVVAADRPSGAALLVAQTCDFIIMDDGFQNPALEKDYSLLVVDSKRGLGNGLPIPAGPLRAPVVSQLGHADAVLVIGEGINGDQVIRSTARRGKPVHTGRIVPCHEPDRWKGKRVLAYAGIADPDKLFISLEQAGADLALRRSFPDHHFYTDEECSELIQIAKINNLELVTTTKDHVRTGGAGRPQDALHQRSVPFEIELIFDDPRSAKLIIEATKKHFEMRLIRH